jgi:phage shock protein PspC (stress-responsive transcriptional regulator)
MLAGVAQGVADNFGIHPWIPRVFFILTAFIGGLGIALYAAGWAFIRSEDEAETPADRFFSGASSPRSWLGIGLIVVAGIIILSNFTFLAAEVIWAGAFLVVGLLLYLGYIPTGGGGDREASSESKEGVQQMTTTETRVLEVEPDGDSPAGGATPPPTPGPTPPERPPAKPREPSILGRLTMGVMLLGLGILAILDNFDVFAVEIEPRHYLALAVTIVGVGLLVGSIAGRARWLILLGAIMIPTLMFSPVFEYDWNETTFDATETPLTFEEVEPNYHVDLGELAIDLRQLPWQGEEIEISATVDAGNLVIYLPDGVGIVGGARVDAGRVSGLGRSTGGLGEPTLEWNDPGPLGTVFLHAEVNLGNIEIHR